jgi:hypothetical protein
VVPEPASPEAKAAQPAAAEPTYLAQPAFFSYRRR